ncbi:MAG TPA: glycosyltransferase family 4 protein [Gemmatimonadales bacterium]|nr:glycosyltransferase family 4 protein [Gemmatimonadales bacterium]
MPADSFGPEGAPAPRAALIVANRLPFPLDDGWKVRTFHITRAVADLVPTVLAVGGGSSERELAAAQEALGASVTVVDLPFPRPYTALRLAAGLLTSMPIHYWNHQSAATHRALRGLAGRHRFDIAVAVTSFMWPYARAVGPAAFRVVDTHNVDSVTMSRYVGTLPGGTRRAYAALTARKMRRLERRVYRAADSVWVCSRAEAELVASFAPTARVLVVPNGVDGSAFVSNGPPPIRSRRLLFFGRLDYYPNLDGLRHFCERVLPVIRHRIPDVELLIVGRGAEREVAELERAGPGVRVVGWVENIASALADASLVVVPLRSGGGTRLKILEALAMARPVVATSIGAEGLDLRPGEEIALADTPEDFADEVVRLLTDPEAAVRLGASGRRAVLRQYDWSCIRYAIHDEFARGFAAGRSRCPA